MDKNAKIFLAIIGVVVLGVIAAAVFRGNAGPTGPGEYDGFAQCLADESAVFYGAFWCQHCQNQKKLFGSSQKLLPYVECSTPNGQGQIKECIDKKVMTYPTWEFADGSRMTGEIPLSTLAEKTSCSLRQSSSEASELPK
ncbi:hypothetical protein HYZ82_03435 [Candidatus Nomurabacteria bacterium]|nr:hypothetical protein [Candidatus Nomurabacteria bacterium]